MTKAKINFYFFLALTIGLYLIAIFADYIVPYDPTAAVFTDAYQAPSSEHLFGTDKMGRDMFSRVIYGARTSLASTTALVFMIFTIGGTLGIIAGYVGGKTDAVIMRLADMMVSFPGMALAIAMAGMMGASIINAVIAITMVSWTKYARLSRSLVLKIRNMDYISAAKLAGSKHSTIIFKYLVPTIMPTLIITAATDMGGMMLELAAFSFLGLGASSTSIEWGYMLNEGRQAMMTCPWLMLYPGIAIFITVVIYNLLGDSIRDVLDPRGSLNIQKGRFSQKQGKKSPQIKKNSAQTTT